MWLPESQARKPVSVIVEPLSPKPLTLNPKPLTPKPQTLNLLLVHPVDPQALKHYKLRA